jgi:hypothetical protein
MALNPSPQRQSVVTFPTPNVNDILFFETVDAERVGPDVPKYGSSHPDYKKWPNHRLVSVQSVDEQSRYYRYYYAADQLEQDNDNWSYSEADIGGTKFDAVSRDYVIRRSEFSSTVPAMGAAMPDTPTGKFSGTHVLAQRKQIPINDKILNGLYVIEQRVYVKKIPLSRLDFDEFFQTTNETKQILYHKGEAVAGSTIEALAGAPDNAYWGMNSGTIRTVQQLSDNWYAVTEKEVVKCPTGGTRSDLQTTSRESITSGISGLTPSTTTQKLFSTYQSGFGINPSLVRNTSCWAHNLKGVTGFVAWNSRTVLGVAGKRLGGVAITPRHIYFAAHANYVVGDTVFFCSKNNEVYSRVIKGVKLNEQYITNTATFDYGVALLDKDLPPSIEVVKVLPKDGYQYFQTEEFASHEWQSPNNASEEVLVMTTDQDENAHIRKLNKLQFGTFDYDNPLTNAHREFQLNPASSPYDTWDEDMVVGDSGSVCCLVVGGECVLLGLLSGHPNNSADDPIGPFVSAPVNYKAINQLITDVDVAYVALTAADDNDSNVPDADKLDNYYSDGYQLQPIDLSFDYKSYRPEEQSQGVGCARLRYETVITYYFPPILAGVEFDVWELRSGGARTYPRVQYEKGKFQGPCRAVVDISWSTTQPFGLAAAEKPEPETISITNPLFTLNIPPTLHGPVNFTVSTGSNDETWEPTNAIYTKGATNVTSWEPHIASSEVKPFRGGWLMQTTTVYPPS